MAKELRFTPRLFEFLGELKANNNREWFEANKQRYLDDVRDPFLAFIAAFRPRLQNISPRYVADPKPSGGSLFRIYRDTRFSKNKAPYKTVASAYFGHEAGKANAPGIYLHFEPEKCFVGIGYYHPDPATRRKVTDAIVAQPEAWQAITGAKELKKRFELHDGELLQRVPKPYDPNHPLAEDLKRKSFIVWANLTEKQVCAKDFLDRLESLCQTSAPFLAFLVRAMGLPWSATDRAKARK